MNSSVSSSGILNKIFDEFIIRDIQNKVGDIHITSSDEIANCLINYVLKHYNRCDCYVIPKISNFYRNHKKFTRFILIAISLMYSSDSIRDTIEKYKFNKLCKWEVEHIVPRVQNYNKFNSKNYRLKSRIGNLALLSKNTNVKISNKSFFKKSRGLSNIEKELKVNEVFCINKVHLSKADIKEREKTINRYIFEIFFKNNGELLRNKLRDYCEDR